MTRGHSVWTLDLAGGLLTAGLLILGGWFGFFHPSSAGADLTRLRAELDLKTKDLASLQHESESFDAALRERQEELTRAGTPPAESPIEDDLRTISELVRRCGLNVTEVSPLATLNYPGVLESRYRLRASGKTSELARAFREFEGCKFWGDITQLQIGPPSGAKAAVSDVRELDLTLSFYSAVDAPAAPAGGA